MDALSRQVPGQVSRSRAGARAAVLLAVGGAVAVVAVVAVLVVTRAPTSTGSDEALSGVVTEVVDGDTLVVDGVGTVRVIGIDTPERGHCGFDEATQAMASLVLGRTVLLVPGAQDQRDRYDRLLRYVEVEGQDAGLEVVRRGLAVARYDSRDGYGRHAREDRYVRTDAATPDRTQRLCP